MGATAGILQGVSTAGGFLAGQRQAGAIEAQSSFEKQLADLNAADVIARGNQSAQRMGLRVRQTIGAQRAGLAANGVALDSGSALDAQTDEARFGAMDEATIRNNAAREAFGITSESTMSQLSAKNRAAAARQSSIDTLITGAVKTYGLFDPNGRWGKKKAAAGGGTSDEGG